MIDKFWFQIGASLLGGGAVGALINAVVTAKRNGIPKIHYRLEKKSIFIAPKEHEAIRPEIILYHGSTAATYDNLQSIDIHIDNKSSRDFSTFSFGVTLGMAEHCVLSEEYSLDRHHKISAVTSPKPDQPLPEIDYTLSPFNRGDSYWLRLYITTNNSTQSNTNTFLSSTEPVIFVETSQPAERILKIAELALKVGPVRIGVG